MCSAKEEKIGTIQMCEALCGGPKTEEKGKEKRRERAERRRQTVKDVN